MLPGTSIAMSVGSIQVGIMDLSSYDTTPLHGVWRITRVHPYTRERVKTVRWLDLDGAREIPQKTRDLESYDLRSWTLPGRFTGTRIWRSGRKRD